MNFILHNKLYNKINYSAYCGNSCEPFIPRFTIVTINISRLAYNRTKNIVNVHNIEGIKEIYINNNVLFSKDQLVNLKPVQQPLQQIQQQLREQKETQQQIQQQLKQILQLLQQKA